MQVFGWMMLCIGLGVLALGQVASGQHGRIRKETQGSEATPYQSITFRVLGLMKTKSGAT